MNILLSGACGRMGRCVAEYCGTQQDCRIIAGIDRRADSAWHDFPVVSDFGQLERFLVELLIDFSSPDATQRALLYSAQHQIPCVICTTGLTASVCHTMQFCAQLIPVFHSANMSVAAAVLQELCRRTQEILGPEWDIDILEQHHAGKTDAPSGTALALGQVLCQDRQLCNEQECTIPRRHSEVVFHSLRAGGSAGEHLVQFASADEVLRLSHLVFDRRVFAAGAIAAARFLIGKPPGLYNMKDLIKK